MAQSPTLGDILPRLEAVVTTEKSSLFWWQLVSKRQRGEAAAILESLRRPVGKPTFHQKLLGVINNALNPFGLCIMSVLEKEPPPFDFSDYEDDEWPDG